MDAPRSKHLGQRQRLLIFSCADATYQEADRKTTKSVYLTAMISELDQLYSQAKELLRKMTLRWPEEKNQPLADNLVGSYC